MDNRDVSVSGTLQVSRTQETPHSPMPKLSCGVAHGKKGTEKTTERAAPL